MGVVLSIQSGNLANGRVGSYETAPPCLKKADAGHLVEKAGRILHILDKNRAKTSLVLCVNVRCGQNYDPL